MKNKIYKILFMLAIMLSAFSARSEVITGISEPFQFGSPAVVDVPLSPIALVIAIGLIGLFTLWRYYVSRKRGMV